MMANEKCEGCGKPLTSGGCINLGSMEDGYRELCIACYNATIAEYMGVDFEHIDFEPVTLTDAHRVNHTFHFNLRLMGDIVVLDAYELKTDERTGYDFQVIGDDPEGEPLELFKKLLEKMHRALSRKHIEEDEEGVIGITNTDTVRAIIEDTCDENGYDTGPLLIIDGKEVTWDKFGRMLGSHVGFHFKMEIYDKSEER